MPHNLAEIGKRIRAERNLKGISQEDLAIALHRSEYSRREIGEWENGKKEPPLDDLLRMCELFDCDISYLLGECDCKTRPVTDVQKEIGLTEGAIRCLRLIASAASKKNETPIGAMAEGYLELYSAFIESMEIVGMVNFYIGKMERISRRGLSEAEEAVFSSEDEAIDTLRRRAAECFLKFMDKYRENTEVILLGGED